MSSLLFGWVSCTILVTILTLALQRCLPPIRLHKMAALPWYPKPYETKLLYRQLLDRMHRDHPFLETGWWESNMCNPLSPPYQGCYFLIVLVLMCVLTVCICIFTASILHNVTRFQASFHSQGPSQGHSADHHQSRMGPWYPHEGSPGEDGGMGEADTHGTGCGTVL